jgi:hypothetical protein
VVTLVAPAMRGRALAVTAAAAAAADLDDLSGLAIEAPDLDLLESAQTRSQIDRQLAALDEMKRPGSVGSVVFDPIVDLRRRPPSP